MAVSTEANILNILKVWYKDGVSNLLFRNSPVVKEITKTRVEGKTQAFACLYGRGGAVAADFLVAKAKGALTSRNAEFTVVPGDIFSVYNMNAKEVAASLSKRGAYMKVAGNKLFGSTEAFRKTVAAAFYGAGYGEIGILDKGEINFTANQDSTITLTDDAIMKIDVGSDMDVKAKYDSTDVLVKLTVKSIAGNSVTVTANGTYNTQTADVVLCLSGSMDGSGGPKLPMGIGGWLPVVNGRTGVDWTNYITKTFMGVNRSANSDRLAGAFYVPAADEKKSLTVQKLLKKVRRQGSEADLIIMNDNDFLAVAQEVETTNTYFTSTAGKGKRTHNIGQSEVTVAFSTSWIDNVYDDPYCPAGKFYILDKAAIELWTYTNAEKVDDGVAGNNPGKQSPESMENEANEGKPHGLLIDDYLTVQSGQATSDGPSVEVTLQMFGSFVVTNPANCGVGLFWNADGYDKVLGYK